MSEKLICDRKFFFNDFVNDENLTVTIKESIEAAFSAYVWPSSVVLAQYIWFNRHLLEQKSFLEIGSGTSLPSIVAFKCTNPKSLILADKVCPSRESLHANGITEYVDHFASVEKKEVNELNQCPVHLCPLTWGEVAYELMDSQSHHQPDIFLGSDCFYDPALFEDAISTVYFLLKSYSKKAQVKTGAKFYCTYQTRSVDWSISDLLLEWGLKCIHIPLESFGADSPNIAMSGLPGKHVIQMLEISLI